MQSFKLDTKLWSICSPITYTSDEQESYPLCSVKYLFSIPLKQLICCCHFAAYANFAVCKLTSVFHSLQLWLHFKILLLAIKASLNILFKYRFLLLYCAILLQSPKRFCLKKDGYVQNNNFLHFSWASPPSV